MKLWELPVDELTKEIVGETKIVLDGDRALVRRNETNLGNLVTDAIISSVADFEHEELDGKIELALVNSGGIRGEIPIGQVSKNSNFQKIKSRSIMEMCSQFYPLVDPSILSKSPVAPYEGLLKGTDHRKISKLSKFYNFDPKNQKYKSL